jgi:hypothetical protein
MRIGSEASVMQTAWPVRLPLELNSLRCLVLAAFFILSPYFLHTAQAEPIRVSAAADASADPAQARQQAQERAFVEAVYQTARRLLPAPLPAPRAELLRQFLAPRAAALVLSFQEAAAAKTAAPASPEKTPAAPMTLEMDVEVNRAAIGELLMRLGLLAGARHPGGFALRLGKGVAETDLKLLSDLLILQGLSRLPQASVQVSLERVPQGYLKAVLFTEAKTYVTDGQDMPLVWLDLWAKYFSAREQQPGGEARPLEVTGFLQVDAVLDFTKTLQAWDDCLREVQLHAVDMRAGNSTGRWSARPTNPERLAERLAEHLKSRKLTAVR